MGRTLVVSVMIGCTWCGAQQSAAQCEVEELGQLLPAGGAEGDTFGCALAVSPGYLIVGSSLDDDARGSAILFDRAGGSFVESATLAAIDGDAGDHFGCAVGTDGTRVLVGSGRGDGVVAWSGCAYVFEYDGQTWVQTFKLMASDGEATGMFGDAVAIDGTVAVVGAPGAGSVRGAAYVFEYDGVEWSETAKLTATDGVPLDALGSAVAISEGMIAVGTPQGSNGSVRTGAVYVFEQDGDSWIETAKLVPADGGIFDGFGASMSLDGDMLVVGSPFHDGSGENAGAAYLFERASGVWSQDAKLSGHDIHPFDTFGASVGIAGDAIVIGSPLRDDPTKWEGAAYLYRNVGGEWLEAAKILPSVPVTRSKFGSAVALLDDIAVVSSPLSDEMGDDAGAAYAFDVACGCPADMTGDWRVDTRDFIAYLSAWSAGDTRADWNGDGTIDTQDFTAYLNDWVVGC